MNAELKQSVESTMKLEQIQPKTTKDDEESQRQVVAPRKDNSEWLKTMVLETIDGLFSTASLMMGVCALTQAHVKAMIVLCGLVGVVVGACSKALAEFMSVSRRNNMIEKGFVPQRPLQSALASAIAFAMGGMIPLMGGMFMKGYVVRLGVVAGVMSLCFAVFGWLGAFLGGASRLRAGLRVLVFGWVAMAITLGLIVLQW